MSEYVLVNDVHLSDKPPASCTETYLDDLFDLLTQAAELGDGPMGNVILAGDVFHHKAPGRTSHATVMRLITWARNCGAEIYAVAGNHDLAHDRLGSLDESQPLGVLFASRSVRNLDGWMDFGGPVYGVPWQMTFDEANVFDALAEYRTDGENMHMGTPHRLVVTHAPLYPPGRELPYENFPATLWAKAMGNTGTVHYGHVHEPHGVYTVDGVTFSNCGALSRGSLHEHNLARTPAVAIWNSETGQIRHQELNAKPADQVFRLQRAEQEKASKLDLNRFLDSVHATRLDITSTASVLDHVRSTQDDPALVAVIENLLTAA